MQSFRRVVGDKVQFSISSDVQCPCGSKKAASKCCLGINGFKKLPSRTTPRNKKTRITNNKCYAHPLNDCSKKISREHYVSKNLLVYLNKDKDLRVKGLPWAKHEYKVVPPDALTSKILCERHNSILSILDNSALRFFNALNEGNLKQRPSKEFFLFSGHDIERWLLKILCGFIASNNLPLVGNDEAHILNEWLDILFGYSDFSNGQGLYFCKDSGHSFSGNYGLNAQAIIKKGHVSGIGITICGYELVLSMCGFPDRVFDGRNFAYRPLEIYASNNTYEKSVMFSWQGHADLGTISVNIPAD